LPGFRKGIAAFIKLDKGKKVTKKRRKQKADKAEESRQRKRNHLQKT
jgi:hypothetical protein